MPQYNSTLISSEQDAWDILELIIERGVDITYLEFDGWPTFNINFKGERYNSTIPAQVINKLANIQNTLNSSYGAFVYNGDARNLKKYEKHEIELLYEIKKGSTDIKADLTGFLNKLGDALSKPSTNKTVAVTLCVIALILSGAHVIGKYYDNDKDIKLEKIKLLEKAIDITPQIKYSSKELQDNFRQIILSASDAQNIKIGENEYNENKIQKLAERNHSIIKRVSFGGDFKIKSMRSYQHHYLIELEGMNIPPIRAKAYLSQVKHSFIDQIAKAMTNNTFIYLNVEATELDDGYANARIINNQDITNN